MLKNLLIKCAMVCGRSDIADEIKNNLKLDDISDRAIKSEIVNLIDLYNFVASSLFEFYIELERCDVVSSDADKKIDYSRLSRTPIKIKFVTDENHKNINHSVKTEYIKINNANTVVEVTYNYLPDKVVGFSDDISYLSTNLEKTIIYGIVSEFFAGKGKLTESEFFERKFLTSAFNLKSKRERRLKSTFSLWEKLLNIITTMILIWKWKRSPLLKICFRLRSFQT